jgi:hypothetical protein
MIHAIIVNLLEKISKLRHSTNKSFAPLTEGDHRGSQQN